MAQQDDICRSCVDCGVKKCHFGDGTYPNFCLTTDIDEAEKAEILKVYEDPEIHNIMIQAANVEYEGYCRLTRVEETIEFARKMGFQKIGIASCVGLLPESNLLARVLRAHGFEVYGVACKAGAIDKTEVGIDPVCKAVGANMCNPILQARKLAKAGTELNIVVGLCVGHDSLFYKHSQALTTTLIVKDRVTGHNPAVPLYLSDRFYKAKLYPPQTTE